MATLSYLTSGVKKNDPGLIGQGIPAPTMGASLFPSQQYPNMDVYGGPMGGVTKISVNNANAAAGVIPTAPTNTIKKVLPSARPGSVASIGTPLGYTDAGVPFYTQPTVTPTYPTGYTNPTTPTPLLPKVPGDTTAPTPAYTYTKTPDEIAADELYAKIKAYNTEQFNTSTDPNEIFNEKLRQYQAQIDSLNNVYNEQIAQARREGQGRIESRQFAQGRAGQIGSGTGEAGINAVQDANRQVEQAIQAERANAIAAVYSKVRSDASAELAARTAAKKEGASALLEDLSKRPERKKARISSAVQTAMSKGLDISKMTDEEIKAAFGDLGSKEEITSVYKTLKDAAETAQIEKEKLTLANEKTKADIAKLQGEDKQKALDRALEQKKIDVSWYNAQTSRKTADNKYATQNNYDAKSIPQEIKSEIITNLNVNKDLNKRDRLSLNEFIAKYPEVQESYLTEIYNQING